MGLVVHPATGVHYAHVITSAWGPFVDLHAMCSHFADRCPWMSVHAPNTMGMDNPLWQDPAVLLVFWQRISGMPSREARQAHTAFIYAEAIGDPSAMLPDHVTEKAQVMTSLSCGGFDAILAHTPFMVDHFKMLGAKAYLYPLGWEEAIYGAPRFDGPRMHDYCYYGSTVGKRELVMPFLKQHLGEHLIDSSGMFGRALVAKLDTCRASLYVAHSDVYSFSTWRTWQTLGSSACLVSEPADTWPLVAGEHFVKLERITWVNVKLVVADLLRMLGDTDLAGVARRAHEEVAHEFTCTKCIDRYLVPVGGEICGS